MRKSLGHTGAVRISVLGGNSSPTTSNTEEEGEFFPSTQGATWNYHEYHSSVQKESGDESDLQKTDDEDDEYAPVIIRGDPLGCFAAVRQILPLVYHRHDPDVVFEVPIHRTKHNLLVGNQGLILAALSAEYEVRIMIPPNDFMNNADGGNYWHQNQYEYGNEIGSAMLFPDESSGNINHSGEINNTPMAINSQTTTLPPNVIQLEGDIEKIEKCLVKMLSIVAGEKWFPTGVIVHPGKENEHLNEQHAEAPAISGNAKADNAKAFAVITANHDSPNIGQNKLRTVQRKTNTLIRRKRGKFFLKGVQYGLNDVDGEEEDHSAEYEDEVDKEDAEEEDDAHGTAATKASISFLISGKIENVKSAASQFEQMLGLEPNSSEIVLKETPVKSGDSPTAKSTTAAPDELTDDKLEKKRRNQRIRRNQRKNKNQKESDGSKADGD
jgi:hypothetical protein